MSRQNLPQLGTAAAGGRDDGGDSTFLTVMVVMAVKRAPPTASVPHGPFKAIGREADDRKHGEGTRRGMLPLLRSPPVERGVAVAPWKTVALGIVEAAAARVSHQRLYNAVGMALQRPDSRVLPILMFSALPATLWLPSPSPPGDPRGDLHHCRPL